MKVLVLGGSRYFGRHLIADQLSKGHDVTVATRGNTEVPAGVKFVKADRKSFDDLKHLASLGPFDIIFDQICMNALDADIAVKAFANSCKRYIFTSTGSVYEFINNHSLVEEDFNPKEHIINLVPTNPTNYQEDKRQAEAVFTAQKFFPAAFVRLPIVLGLDDYTERLKFHVQRIRDEKEIFIPRLDTKMSFIDSTEAGKFISFLGEQTFTGPINAASNGAVTLRSLIAQIEKATGKKTDLARLREPENSSPFGAERDFVLDNNKATSLGFSFMNLEDYLPKLITAFIN